MVTVCCGIEYNIAEGVTRFRCTKCRTLIVVADLPPEPPQVNIERTSSTQEHWAILHRAAFTSWDHIEQWYRAWEIRIPNINCDCRKHWKDWVAANPPDFDDFFAWTVAAHNAVNARLDKPLMSVEEARELYSERSL